MAIAKLLVANRGEIAVRTFRTCRRLGIGTVAVAAPDDRGYIMRYDLDAVHLNAGFWPGDDAAPTPGFYAYLVPRPDGCENAPIRPELAGWVETMGEWMMPYDAVRTCEDPRQAVLDFLASVYEVAVTQGGWDADAYGYLRPAPSAHE